MSYKGKFKNNLFEGEGYIDSQDFKINGEFKDGVLIG